ncbi:MULTISPECIES: cation diffusion facilitator family transporter [unclassified Psychrobacter]|uniref:cation diffusion facilitator family transporter n=1 Tax=unclassified Psychrobacter TaxID=196806 RepID=UPI0025B59AC5|nr:MULTISPECIES: cation diffusion facilitator family transporter [unclassified Psychrobacter]MDN3452529.1 cation diffusion facilitator family transporter [Psychrobacter sp. APC 3350]MDN3502331.1 cation diffusion facilitator family transporter [Psychrobacter sp. 5A.1]
MNQNEPNSEEHKHKQNHNNGADLPKHLREDDENNYTHDNQGRHDHDEHLEQTTAARDTKGYQRTLLFSFVIITGYMFVEAIGGWLTGSLALLSDAGHMLSDAIALGATLMAFKIGEKAATHQKTFGYKRFEILVATVNGATLVIIALMIFYEAIKRFNSPPEIATQGMLIVATIGMLVNILVAWLMHRGSQGDESHGHSHGTDNPKITEEKSDNKAPVNLNMQSAYLHVLSDLMGSVAAIIAALLMMGFGWVWADAVASVIVAVLILFSGYRVVRDSVHILMEGTPENISLTTVEEKLVAHPQVQKVHDLHVWSITSGLNALSCHVVVDGEMSIHESSILITNLEKSLLTLGIHHATIQVESSSHPQNISHSDALVCDISEQAADSNSHIGHTH